MSEPKSKYLSYLLRLWQARRGEGLAWLASLENARTGERRVFLSLGDLLQFLRERTELTSDLKADGRST